jgi:hypothetical protein
MTQLNSNFQFNLKKVQFEAQLLHQLLDESKQETDLKKSSQELTETRKKYSQNYEE